MTSSVPQDVAALLAEHERTQVLVLTSDHLGKRGERFRPALLDGLIERLKRLRPDLIALEHLPPQVVRQLDTRADLQTPLQPFIGKRLEVARLAQQVLALDFERAAQQADTLLTQR